MPSTSMPRAATSVATSVSTRPDSKRASACSRWRWDLSPCIATALTPSLPRRLTSRSAPRLVRTKTSARSRSERSSRTSALTRARASTAQEAVLDLRRLDLGRDVLVARRVVRVLLRDAAGLAVERRAEEQRLAVARALRDDAVDGRAEAHVEHAVGLVEDEDLDVAQAERAALQQVLEAARGRDDDVRLGRLAALLLEADAAVDGGDLQRRGRGRCCGAPRRSAWRARASGRG